MEQILNRQEHIEKKLGNLSLHLWLEYCAYALLMVLFSWLVILLSAVLAAAFISAPGPGGRIITIAAAALMAVSSILLLSKMLRRFPTRKEAAALVEKQHPANDVLRSSLDFHHNWERLNDCYSSSMMAHTMRQAQDIYHDIDFVGFVDRTRLVRIFGLFMAVAALTSLVAFFSPGSFSIPLVRLAMSWGDSTASLTARMAVSPGNARRFRGDSMTIEAAAVGLPKDTPFLLKYRPAGDEQKTCTVVTMHPASRSRYQATLPPLEEDLFYFVTAGTLMSKGYTIMVTTRPEVTGVKITYVYPPYTGLKPRTRTSQTRHIVGVKGTRATMEITTSKQLKQCSFVNEKGVLHSRLKELGPTQFTGTLELIEEQTFRIRLQDREGYASTSLPFQVLPLVDKIPKVTLTAPGKDITMPQDFSIPLEMRVEDDFGIDRIVLKYNLRESEEATMELVRLPSPKTSENYRFDWDLSGVFLSPHDIILYHVQAADTDNISGPKWGSSRTFSIQVPSIYDFYEEIEDDQLTQEQILDEILEEETTLTERTEKLASEITGKDKVGWEDKKKLEEIQQRQESLSSKMEELKSLTEKTIEKMKQNPFINLETMVKMSELNELMEDILSDEMKKVLEDLRRAASRLQFTPSPQELEKAAASQENVKGNLERMIDLLKRIKQQQALDAAIKKGEDLLKQQNELIEKTTQLKDTPAEEKTPDEIRQFKRLSFEQTALSEEESRWEKDLQDMAEKFEQSSQQTKDELQKTLDDLDKLKIGDRMQQASESLGSIGKQKALNGQTKAASSLQDILEQLKQARESFTENQREDLTHLIDRALYSGLELSNHQERVIDNSLSWKDGKEYDTFTPTGSPMSLEDLASYQLEVREGAGRYAGELVDLSHTSFLVPPGLAAAVNQAEELMQGAEEQLASGRAPPAIESGQQAMALINRVVRVLLQIRSEAQQCQSPMGLDKLHEQIRQMAQNQRNLMQMLQQAGDLSSLGPSQKKMLQQMAMQQELIRQAMEELMKQAGQHSKLSKKMGEMAREMREIEDKLRQGKEIGRVKDKQKQLYHRMMDLQHSMHQQEYERRRKAEQARDFTRDSRPEDLPSDLVRDRQVRYQGKSSFRDERVPEQYRELIELYFKRLSRD